MKYVIDLDQGTTSSRAILIDEIGNLIDIKQKEFSQIFPNRGWVEHDPLEILSSQIKVFEDLLSSNSIDPKSIISLGITNQRETTVLWDKDTGNPLYNAIVWQDKRTANICQKIKRKSKSNCALIRQRGWSKNPFGTTNRQVRSSKLFSTL